MSTTLTPAQIDFYLHNDYLVDLPQIYNSTEMITLNDDLKNLMTLLTRGETAKDIREWHETSTFLYNICMNSAIHDLVEGIIGPNFYC